MSDLAVKVSEPIALKARLNEDWLAVVIGLLVFGLALVSITGTDLLGWAVTTSVYTDVAKALSPFAKAYAWLGGGGALLATYAALLVVLSAPARGYTGGRRQEVRCRIHGRVRDCLCELGFRQLRLCRRSNAGRATEVRHRAVLKLTNEGGYIVALLVGLVIANFLPRFAEWLKETIRPELYIKVTLIDSRTPLPSWRPASPNLASSLLLRGAAAIVEAYLIYWAVIYYISRKWFGFSREWSVPLASPGIIDLRRGGGNCHRRRRSGRGRRCRSWCRRWWWCIAVVEVAESCRFWPRLFSGRSRWWPPAPGSGLRSRPMALRLPGGGITRSR